MTQFEGPDSECRRDDDAAPAGPASVNGSPAAGAPPQVHARTGLSRWRTPLLAAAAVVVIGVATALIVQHRGDDAASKPGGAKTGQQNASSEGATRGADTLATTPARSEAPSVAAGQIPERVTRDEAASEGDAGKADALPDTHAEPFDCGGAATTDQVLIDEWVRVGISGGIFCAETGGGDTGPAVQHAEVPIDATGPLLAMTRVGIEPFEAQVAGLADASVTRIVAVRGNEDASDPADIIRDEPLDRYDAGAGRTAFQVPDTSYTVAVVLYAGDTEVGRFPLPVTEAAGMPEESETYDVRTDLVDVRPIAWSSWLRVDESTVRLFFLGGPAVCYGAVVAVRAEADAVRIGIKTGWKPETDVCTDNLVSASVDVPLGEPLAGRPVEPLLP